MASPYNILILCNGKTLILSNPKVVIAMQHIKIHGGNETDR